MKNVCVVTASRSEYGLLRYVIDELKKVHQINVQLIVTGTHLSPEYGYTYREIEKDGIHINKKIEYLLSSSTSLGIIKSMGVCAISFADTLDELKPDLLIVLGDRYELLPICSASLISGIPIAHISGGDITEGAIDNQIRNAITMMATLHFPGTQASKRNIVRMLNSTESIYVTGETNLDNFKRNVLLKREVLASNLSLDSNKNWLLVTLHPETTMSLKDNMSMAYNMMDTLLKINNIEIVITQANADLGGVQMNDYYSSLSSKYSFVHFIRNLGQLNYLSFMNEAACIIGNSSSGIVEAPFLGIPVVNIGNRQKGRYICPNIFCCGINKNEISTAFTQAFSSERFKPNYYFGRGNSSKIIAKHIMKYLDIK